MDRKSEKGQSPKPSTTRDELFNKVQKALEDGSISTVRGKKDKAKRRDLLNPNESAVVPSDDFLTPQPNKLSAKTVASSSQSDIASLQRLREMEEEIQEISRSPEMLKGLKASTIPKTPFSTAIKIRMGSQPEIDIRDNISADSPRRNLVRDIEEEFTKATEEELSEDSGPHKISAEAGEFYVKADVNFEDASLALLISSSKRPKTYLGRKQGEHITAYTVFIRAILEAANEENIYEIPRILQAMAKKFIPEELYEKLDERIKEICKKMPGAFNDNSVTARFNKVRRKMITARERAAGASPEQQEEIKIALRCRESLFLGKLIDTISQAVIEGINQHQEVLYQRPKKKTRQELGREGAKIREAMRHLSEINKDINADSTPSTRELERIGALVFDLFDLDFHEYRAFLLLNELDSSSEKSNLKEFQTLLTTKGMTTVHAFENFCASNNVKKQLKIVDKKIYSNATQIIEKHFDAVIRHAFPNINSLPLEAKEVIYTKFFQLMQSKMSWQPDKIDAIKHDIMYNLSPEGEAIKNSF